MVPGNRESASRALVHYSARQAARDADPRYHPQGRGPRCVVPRLVVSADITPADTDVRKLMVRKLGQYTARLPRRHPRRQSQEGTVDCSHETIDGDCPERQRAGRICGEHFDGPFHTSTDYLSVLGVQLGTLSKVHNGELGMADLQFPHRYQPTADGARVAHRAEPFASALKR